MYVYIAKTFKDDTLQELKIQYYELLNRICNDKDEYLDMANNHYCIFQTPLVQEKAELWTGESRQKTKILLLGKRFPAAFSKAGARLEHKHAHVCTHVCACVCMCVRTHASFVPACACY